MQDADGRSVLPGAGKWGFILGIFNITAAQVLYSLLAIPAFFPAFVCTGYMAAWFTNLHSFRQRSLVERFFWSVPLSIATSTIASVLIGKFVSLAAVVAFFLMSAALCLVTLGREWLSRRRSGRTWIVGWRPLGGTAMALAMIWIAAAILSLVDWLRKAQQHISHQLERAGKWLDAREKLLVALLVLAYIILVLPNTYSRPLWHDELYTYNIALSASIPQMLECLRRVDLNPPLLYFLNYLTLRLPGAQANEHITTMAARLPSLLSGLIASLGLFALLRKRIGPLYSLATVVVLWNTLFLIYAWEDRPYALVCALLTLMILAWQRATQPGRNPLWVIAVLGLGCALLGSHFMGCFLLLAFLAAEAVQIRQRGRADILLCIALLVPFAIPVLYRSKIVSDGFIVFPQAFQPSILTIGVEYLVLLNFSIVVFMAAMLVCLMAGRRLQACDSQDRFAQQVSPPTLSERVLLLVLLLEPMLFVVLQMVRHSAFFPRYGLTGCIPLSILMVAFFYSHFQGLRRVAMILVGVSVIVLIWPKAMAWATQLQARSGNEASAISHQPDFHQVEPNLPFVVASGLTFVEMNHRESSEFLHRTYYLTDRSSAIKYAHSTLFEGEAEVGNVFHFQSHIESLQSFEAAHSKFLVFGTMDYPEDWLLRKLQADGDSLHDLGKFESTYKDVDLYEVTLNSRHK